MSFGIREATKDEIEWLKVQLDPPGFYLEQFLKLKKKYSAIEVDTPTKASRLKGSLKRTITKKELDIRVFNKENVVLLVNDGIEEGSNDA